MKTLRASKKRFSESPLREGESNSREDKSGEYRWLAAYEIVIRLGLYSRSTNEAKDFNFSRWKGKNSRLQVGEKKVNLSTFFLD